MRIALVIGLSGILGATLATQADSLLEKQTKQLQTATTLDATYTVQVVGSGPIEYTLKLAKPSNLRLDSPTQTIVANATMLWIYNKNDNTYTQAARTENDLRKYFSTGPALPWRGFFSKDPFKNSTGEKMGSSHILKGKKVTDVSLTLGDKPERTVTLFMDDELGIPRGMDLKTNTGTETIVIAKDLAVSSDPAKDSDFDFAIPAGAKQFVPVTFDKVATILQANCVGCHGSSGPKSGLDLTSYSSVMAGGRGGKEVVPGDADGSRIMSYLKANGKPIMPPGGSLSDSDIATISGWIKGGAIEK